MATITREDGFQAVKELTLRGIILGGLITLVFTAANYPVVLIGPMGTRSMLLDRLFVWGDAPMRSRAFLQTCGQLGLLRHRGRQRINYQFPHPTIQRYLAEGRLGSGRSSTDREDEPAV